MPLKKPTQEELRDFVACWGEHEGDGDPAFCEREFPIAAQWLKKRKQYPYEATNSKTKEALRRLALAQRGETEASRQVERRISRLQREAQSTGRFSQEAIQALSEANDALNKAEAIAGSEIIEFANNFLE